MAELELKTQSIKAVALFVAMTWMCVNPVVGADGVDTGPEPSGLFGEDIDAKENPEDQEIKVGSFGQVDLHVKDLEVSQVLQLLSLQSQRNIIASRNVAGSISADLYGVDFYEALDAILHTNGFGYQEKGNLIFVYTTAELDTLKEAERKTTHRIIRLNYITAADASAFITPLLSPAGSVSVSGEVAAGFQPSIGDGGANSFAHTDTLIIYDYPENVDEILAVLQELDKRPKQVLVEATILQARLTETNAFGVDLSVLTDFAINKFLDPIGIVEDVLSLGVDPTDPSVTGQWKAAETTVGNTRTGSSGARIGIVTDTVAAFVRALDAVTDTTVIANPKVLVLNRQKADLLVGEKLGYLSSTATDTSTTQTVEFLEIGTQLTLRPFVSDDGFIRIELRPSVSDGNTNRTVGSFVVPETTNQELTTNVVVRNGQTVVLGGLFKEDTEVTRRQVPGLGDIPILGVMFKGQDDTVARNEVIFLITPTIIKDEALNQMGDRVAGSIESARLGAREGLLPWSRTKMISSHIRDAQEFYDQGEMEKAYWSVNMALTLDPKATEAIRLKERLSGQRARTATNLSILDEAIGHIIDGQSGPAPPLDTPDSAAPFEPSGSSVPTGSQLPSQSIFPDDTMSQPQAGGGDPVLKDDPLSDEEIVSKTDLVSQEPASGHDVAGQSGQPWLKNFFDTKKLANQSAHQDQPVKQADASVAISGQTENDRMKPGFDKAGVEFADDADFPDLDDSQMEDDEELWFDVIESDSQDGQDISIAADTDPQAAALLRQEGESGWTDEPSLSLDSDQEDRSSDRLTIEADPEDDSVDVAPILDRFGPDDLDFDLEDEAAIMLPIDEPSEQDQPVKLPDHGSEDVRRKGQGSPLSEPQFEEGQLRISDRSNEPDDSQIRKDRFESDRVPSTDPFHAVVEWLPLSRSQHQDRKQSDR